MRVTGFLRVADEHRNDEIAKRLPASSEHHHLSSAPVLNIGNTDQTKQQIGNRITSCEQPRKLVVEPDRVDQHGWEIVRGDVDARELRWMN